MLPSVKVFLIPLWDGGVLTDEMNKFMRTYQVVEVNEKCVEISGVTYYSYRLKY